MIANTRHHWVRSAWMFAIALAIVSPLTRVQAAATIVILNNDGAGEGFNDPTPAAPIGGNTGTTLGQQRLIAFQHAANIWGATLTSSVATVIRANIDPLTCTATAAVLGAAGPISVSANFPNAPFTNTWYHAALANKFAGADLGATPEIGATFNSNLGQTNCLTGIFFYLGLDGNHGANVDFVAVLLHEFGHGLGFSTTTNGTSGAFLSGLPSVFDRFLLDTTSGLFWNNMTNAERVASAINTGRLTWAGVNVAAEVPTVLGGTPELGVNAPAAVAGTYGAAPANFGLPLSSPGLTGTIMPILPQTAGAGVGCEAFNAANTLAANNKIALIDRGVCGFVVKVKNAQNAGAVGVVVVNNVPGAPGSMGGSDPTITIPSVMISLADGAVLKDALKTRSRSSSGMVANLHLNLAIRAGADASGRMLMFAPNPFQGGSSVSHWDISAFPNQLMEPNINTDLTHSVVFPRDLTYALLRDIGWQ